MPQRVLIVMPGVILLGALLAAVYARTQAAPGFTIPASTIIHRVASVYGEQHPRIVRVDVTHADPPPHGPMYFIVLAGHFHQGHVSADKLYFSALADRRYVWGIQGYAGHGHQHRSRWRACTAGCSGVIR